MTTLAQLFGTSTAFTLNNTSWTQATTISSTGIDLSVLSPIPDDVMITVDFVFPNSAPANQKAVNLWVAVSEDGTHYTDNDQYSGTNNTQSTLRSPTNFYGPFVIPVNQNITGYGVLASLRGLCGGILPRKFGIILENQGGQTITSPAASYTPVNFTNT